MQNFSSFGPFREKIGSNSQNSGRQLQQNEGRSRNSDKSLFIIGPKEAVSSSGLKKGAPQFQLGTIVNWPTVKTPSLPTEIVNQMTNFIILFDILDGNKMKLHLYKATKVCFRSD